MPPQTLPREDPATMSAPITIRAEMRPDGEGWYELSCLSLPVHTCTRDESQARMMIVDAVQGFFEGCERAGTLREVFASHGYRVDENNGRYPAIQLDFGGEMIDVEPVFVVGC